MPLDNLPASPQLETRLRRELEGEVMFDRFSRGRYSTDASIYQIEPLGVVVPKGKADVAAALQIAREEGVPVLPRGGGTSQCGQTVAAPARSRNMAITLALILITLLLTAGSTVRAADFQNIPFDLSVERLPPGFVGADLSGVYNSLAQRQSLHKEEFETTEAFKRRKAEIARQPVLGSLLLTSVYAFSHQIKNSKYDADRGILDFQPESELLISFSLLGDKKSSPQLASVTDANIPMGLLKTTMYWTDHEKVYDVLIWDYKESRHEMYQATNGFGAAVAVSRWSEQVLGLAWCMMGRYDPVVNFKPTEAAIKIPWDAFQVKLSPEAARRAKSNARALIIGKLTDFGTGAYTSMQILRTNQPTLNDPRDTNEITRAIGFDASEVWIYDKESGDVFLKFRLPEMIE